jgi:colanic acid biosynthesis protein WcaH
MTSSASGDEFAHVVRLAPLVSIDLIIRDDKQNVFVGLPTNEPAKGLYFVPGGRIRKHETIENAFARILENETGCRANFTDARFLGVFQHFYPTNRHGLSGYGTHYVVLAYEVRSPERQFSRLRPSVCSWRANSGAPRRRRSAGIFATCSSPIEAAPGVPPDGAAASLAPRARRTRPR